MLDHISIFENMENTLEDGFLSMVDGTSSVKGAFKDMARSVVSELYKVYVLQQAIGSLGSGTGILGALGGALSFGTGLNSSAMGGPLHSAGRASGGTVMANQPYLVGEKGPELIMPQNRGHVMNADLTANAMGSESISVVNHFQFSANGDDSVKRIIAQAVPTIVDASKKAIVSDRRRGGAMRNAFG
ncbi:MAG: hypothetical protein P8Q48_16195 [Paracoccaceae bacterium]|nr:hypothetical protein [Paracoccaceae bacterium]